MTILVCPLAQVARQIERHRPERIVSLLDPGDRFPETGYGARHLQLEMHDVEVSLYGERAPHMEHARELIAFVRAWPGEAPLLIHCRAGVSRSTASAYVAACARNPDADAAEIARALRAASPTARPNPALVMLADEALQRRGRMIDAYIATFHDLGPVEVMEAEPFSLASRFNEARR